MLSDETALVACVGHDGRVAGTAEGRGFGIVHGKGYVLDTNPCVLIKSVILIHHEYFEAASEGEKINLQLHW